MLYPPCGGYDRDQLHPPTNGPSLTTTPNLALITNYRARLKEILGSQATSYLADDTPPQTSTPCPLLNPPVFDFDITSSTGAITPQ
jgi:hypothetical protein